jgi:hypothetical protein
MPVTTRHIPRIQGRGLQWWYEFKKLPLLKKLFWLYFLLLIFEGVLRKWAMPQYSAQLLLVRDPVSVFIIWEAFRTHKWPERWSAVTAILVAVISALALIQVMMNDVPWFVAVYGLRSYVLPFPVAFIMGENIDGDDLRRFGICTLVLLIPMVALEVQQYRSPDASLINIGAGEGAHQTHYVGGHVRASGTFSYVVGPTLYAPMAAAFIFFGLISDRFAKRWLLWAATFALILSAPAVGSRTLVYELAEVVVCAAIAALCGVTQFVRSLRIVIPLVAMFFLVSLLPVFSQASESLTHRFTDADQVEGGTAQSSVERRAFGPFIGAILETDFASNLTGRGIGMGAAAIAKLTTGRRTFLAGEYEITRLIFEFGPILGFAYAAFNFGLTLFLGIAAINRARQGAPLALLMMPLLFGSLAWGVLEQPTEQGFMVIGLAFSLAALERTKALARKMRELRPLARPLPYSAPAQ